MVKFGINPRILNPAEELYKQTKCLLPGLNKIHNMR